MMRVLRLITRLNIGGPSQHVRILGKGLRDFGFETLLAAGPGSEDEGLDPSFPKGSFVEVPHLVRGGGGIGEARAAIEIGRLIRDSRPEIVHTHQAKAGFYGRLLARLLSVPVRVHTYHGHVMSGYFGRVTSRIVRLIESLLSRTSSAIVVQSGRQADEIGRLLGSDLRRRIHVIAPAVDLELLDRSEHARDAVRRELRLKEADVAVGWIGRIAPVKGGDRLLEILAACRSPYLVGVLVGDGPGRPVLERRARELGIADRCRFAGFRTPVGDVIRALDVIACTSRNEGTPLALIEAQALGVPVVSFDIGGVRDIVADTSGSSMVAAGDVSGFAERLLRLAVDGPLRSASGALAREFVRRKFRPERLCSEVAALYAALLRSA
jgi:glycosyltransferase involved in cell wall biosynthesis